MNEKNKKEHEENWLPEKEASALDYDQKVKDLFHDLPVE